MPCSAMPTVLMKIRQNVKFTKDLLDDGASGAHSRDADTVTV